MCFAQDSWYRRRKPGFTLIEVLVVVAIIALLISILLPSLARAREQARRAKCLANMSSLGKAVMAFSVGHQGRGQLIGRAEFDKTRQKDLAAKHYDKIDASRKFFAYEPWFPDGTGFLRHKAWPVAYAREMGYTSLKHTDNYFEHEEAGTPYIADWPQSADPLWFWARKGKFEVFYCPSDTLMIRDSWSPDHNVGVMSYAANLDVFGYTPMSATSSNSGYGTQAFALGANGGIERRDQLIGRLDGIVRPSEVALFADMGNESIETVVSNRNSNNPGLNHVSDVFFSAADRISDANAVPYGTSYLDGSNRRTTAFAPISRHGTEGGLCVAFSDGHGSFVNGNRGFVQLNTSLASSGAYGEIARTFVQGTGGRAKILVTRAYIPEAPRVTPYNPLRRPATLAE